MARQLKQLKTGERAEVPIYDFATHTRSKETNCFEPTSIILVDGILILGQAQLREIFDYSVFIECDESLRFERRLKRDTVERGRTEEGVKNQIYEQVKPMHDEFVEPSKQYADLVVTQDRFDQELTALIEKIHSNQL